jgi:cytochrome c556
MPTIICIMLTALFAVAVPLTVRAHEGVKGVVKERMDAMESMAKAMKAISQKIKSKRDLESIKREAKSIQEGAAKMPSLFPSESDGHPSAAQPAIWSRWTDFEAKAQELATESGKLAEADTRDAKGLTKQVARVSQTCSSCHDTYRAKHQH